MTGVAWRVFRRTGSVRAQRLQQALTWTTDNGDVLSGQEGDWRVEDGARTWTVADEQFRRSYEPDGDRYRRRGTVRARPGQPGEVIETLEGRAHVAAGDWVVMGEGGEQWPVPAERFAQAYAPV